MPTPTGRVIATPKFRRACGCEQPFPFYAVDKGRAERLAEFKATRCHDCAAPAVETQQQDMPAPKNVLAALPPGAQVTLSREPDGSWAGALTAEGVTVEVPGLGDAGPQAVVVRLTRLWLGRRPPE